MLPAGEEADMQTGPTTEWALGARGLITAGLVLMHLRDLSPRPTTGVVPDAGGAGAGI